MPKYGLVDETLRLCTRESDGHLLDATRIFFISLVHNMCAGHAGFESQSRTNKMRLRL